MITTGRVRIALTGYSQTGKDEVGKILVGEGFERVALGDLIKRDLDPLIRQHFGFSAFTEVDEEKAKVRRLMEEWGFAQHERLLAELMHMLPLRAVNTKLVRPAEAIAWKEAGGVVVQVERPGFGPHTDTEIIELDHLWHLDLVDKVIVNDGSIGQLRDRVRDLLLELR